MKLLTEKEIKEMASNTYLHFVTNPTKATIADAWEEGYTQAQQDLISQASEGFEDYLFSMGAEAFLSEAKDSVDLARYFWQACSVSHAKKMQEKDAEIEALTKEKDVWKTMYSELKSRVVGA